MSRWTLPVVIGAVALAATAAAFGVSRAGAATLMHQSAASGAGGGGHQGMMGKPAAMKAMLPLHAVHVKDMQAWQDKYRNDPTSAEAQAALKQMRKEHVAEMRTTLRKLGVKVPAGACGTSMMDGTSGIGMMGGIGATGDVHQQHHAENATTSGGVSSMMGGAAY